MLKKIIILILIVHTILSADSKEKAFFIGFDYQYTKVDTVYETNGQFAYPRFVDSDSIKVPGIKLGYQYHFTRVYAEYTKLHENYETYSIRSKLFDLNFEYVPSFYNGDDYMIRGIFGLSIGLDYTRMYDLKRELLDQHQVSLLEDYEQNQMMYGFQVGAVYENESGISIDLGLRIRRGDYIQMKEETQSMSIKNDRKVYYVGLNFLL